MQPIRADDQVEAARRRTLERRVHTLSVILQRRDGISEDELDVVPACLMQACLMQDGREVAARELDVLGRDRSAQCFEVDVCGAPSLPIEKAQA